MTAQLIQQLQHTDQPASATDAAPGLDLRLPRRRPPSPRHAPSVPCRKTGGNLDGPAIRRHHDHGDLCRQRAFHLESDPAGEGPAVYGTSSYENGILTLVQEQNNNAMVGNVVWKDASHFTFKVLGGGPTDPGLSFTKVS